MKIPRLFQAAAVAAFVNTSCTTPYTLPDAQSREPEHTNCIKVYLETRNRIFEIMEERDLNYRDLINFYGIYPNDLGNLRDIHPQAYESRDICAVITSPIYYYIYRILERYPEGRYPDGIPDEY